MLGVSVGSFLLSLFSGVKKFKIYGLLLNNVYRYWQIPISSA